MHRRIPHYPSDSDYTTNAPDFYDFLARMNKLIKVLAERIGHYDKELAKRFEEWDQLISKFPENVEKLLIQWLEDGTLDDIINVNIFKDLNGKIDSIRVEFDKHKIDFNNLKKDVNDLEKELNNHLEVFTDFYNKTVNKLEHFIINIDEFEGTATEKIQAALNEAHKRGGATVYVPARTYILEDELVIYGNTTLWSQEGTVYIRNHKGYMLMNGVRGENYRRYDGHGNIKVINGVFDGKAQNELGGQGSNIAFAHADTLLFDNVTVLNANSHSIEINSSQNVVIRNCKILGQLATMQYVEGIQLDLATQAGFPAFGEHDNTMCRNVHIHNCYFGASDDLPSLSRGIGTHATRIGAYMENILIENNVFDGLRDFAIQFLCYKDSVIKNNTFNNCTGGIIMYSSNPDNTAHQLDIYNQPTTATQPCTNITVEGNTLNRCNGKQLIYVYGRSGSRNKHFKVIGNKIFNSSDNSGVIVGIYTDNIEVSHNIIENVTNFGINVRNSTHILIDSNKLKDTTTHTAIRVNSTIRYLTLTNNHIHRAGGNGIEIQGDVYTITVTDNLIVGVNGGNDGYRCIYIHSTGGKIVVANNVMRKLSGFEHGLAVYITSSITDGILTGNVADLGSNENKYAATGLTITNNI